MSCNLKKNYVMKYEENKSNVMNCEEYEGH